MDVNTRRVQIRQAMIKKGYLQNKKDQWIHRKVCNIYHGKIPKHWVVHHTDYNHKNNMPNNLIALPRRVHDHIHGKKIKPSRQEILDLALAAWNREIKNA